MAAFKPSPVIRPDHAFIPLAELASKYADSENRYRTDWRLQVLGKKFGALWDRPRKGWWVPPDQEAAVREFAAALPPLPPRPPRRVSESRPRRAATGVTEAEYAVLQDIARRTGQDVSGLVRRVLTDVIGRWKTTVDAKL